MKKNKAVIIHHCADADGRLSGYVAGNHFKETHDVEYIGWDYHMNHEELIHRLATDKDLVGGTVVITDLSLPRKQMEEIKSWVPLYLERFIWIDHHISAIRELEDIGIEGVRFDGIAACKLACDYFHLKPTPKAINLAAVYDVWNKDSLSYDWDTEVIPFQFFLRSINLDIETDEGLVNCAMLMDDDGTNERIEFGKLLVEAEKQSCKKLNFFDVMFEGVRFRAVNKIGGSTIFEFAEETGESLMAFSVVGPDTVKFSMYKGTVERDLSVIAKKWKGGGHANACGFTTTIPLFAGIISGSYK
jgi:oligoribonuclease NrnB/cAMP/cGMP phosphodiesterase (DHH superfamily)